MISVGTIKIAIPAVILLVLVLDVVLWKDRVPGNTYSEVIRAWFLAFEWLLYLIALLLGIVFGHWMPL